MDDDEVDDADAEALAYLRGVCSICNTQVAGSRVMCDTSSWPNNPIIGKKKTIIGGVTV